MAIELPAFIRLEYDQNNRAASTMLADLERALAQGERRLTEFSNIAQDQLDRALSVKRNDVGSLDLGVDQLKASAAAMEARAIAAREVANATRLAAKEQGDLSVKARMAEAATEALAIEEEKAAKAARAQADAAAQVQEVLNRQASATDAVVAANRRGTDSYGNVINSVRAQRVAFIQLGQQMQDVVIQTQMGANGMTIFTQQVPQMAFALSGLSESQDETLSKVGEFAGFLSGPWGAALFGATALLGPLIMGLFDTGEAADQGGSAIERLADKLDLSKNSYESLIAVVDEYNKSQKDATALTYEAIVATEAQARAKLKEAEATLAAARVNAQVNAGQGVGGAAGAYAGGESSKASAELAMLKADLDKIGVALGTENVKRITDERYKIETDYNVKIAKLTESRSKGLKDQISYERELLKLQKAKTAALDAYDEAHKKSRGSSRDPNAGYGREIDMATAMSIARAAGYQVNSGTRTYAEQKKLYDAWVAAGKPADNPTAKPGTSAHERSNALDIQFGKGITAESIRKAYANEGVRLTKILKERGHFHIEWSTKGADKIEREADKLAQFGEQAGERIMRINEAFDEQPRLIDRANQATRDLDATIAELTARKPEGWQKLIEDAKAAKATIQDALVRPFAELTEQSERRLTTERLLTAGREDEARALQIIWDFESRVGDLTDDRKQSILDMVRLEREQTEELRRRQDVIGEYLSATRSIKQELASIFSGQGSLGNLAQIGRQLNGQILAEKLFGQAFRDMDKWIKQQSGIQTSVDFLAEQTTEAGGAVKTFADVVLGQAKRIANGGSGSLQSEFDAVFGGSGALGGFGSGLGTDAAALARFMGAAANDNAEITVKAIKSSAIGLSPEEFFARMGSTMSDATMAAIGIDSPVLRNSLAGALTGTLGGGRIGGIVGALSGIPGIGGFFGKALGGLQSAGVMGGLNASLGLGLSNNGMQIGSMIGSVIPGIGPVIGSLVGGIAGGKNLTKSLGLGVGGLAGFALGGPVGAIVGTLLGGLLGGVLGKRPRGAAEVSNTSVYAHTNDSALTSSTNDWGSAVQTAVQRVADALGVNVGNYSIGLGRYKDYYQVSTQSGDPRLGNSYFSRNSPNDVYDGTDAEAATRAAVIAAIQNGAVAGISQASLNILKAGKDLDAALKKAVLIESVPKRLKKLTDPVGAALDDLNKEFSQLVAALREGGASAEQFAQAQKLYDLERAQAVKQATEQVVGSLKDLLESLTVGNDALSLRDRKAMALAAYQPLAARVAAGDATAFNEYAAAARTLLDIERQMSGSQSGYFDLLKQVTDLTSGAINSQQALIDAANASDSPFSNTAVAANDNQGVIDAINTGNSQLGNINTNLITLTQLVAGGGGTGRLSMFDALAQGHF